MVIKTIRAKGISPVVIKGAGKQVIITATRRQPNKANKASASPSENGKVQVIIRTIRVKADTVEIAPAKSKAASEKPAAAGRNTRQKQARIAERISTKQVQVFEKPTETILPPVKAEAKQEIQVDPGLPSKSGMEKKRKQSDHWSDCGQIFFTGDKAFAVTPNLRTICLGTEYGVREFLDTEKIDDSLAPFQKEILIRIKENANGVIEKN